MADNLVDYRKHKYPNFNSPEFPPEKRGKRKPQRYGVTYPLIAEVSGASIHTVRAYRAGMGPSKKGPVLTPEQFLGLVRFVNQRVPLVGELAEPEHLDRFGPHARKWWANRFPRLEAYKCPCCRRLILHQGSCRYHGGPQAPALRFAGPSREYAIEMLTKGGSYAPMHHLVVQSPRSHVVLRLDGNPWNNRADNFRHVPQQDWKAWRASPDHEEAPAWLPSPFHPETTHVSNVRVGALPRSVRVEAPE